MGCQTDSDSKRAKRTLIRARTRRRSTPRRRISCARLLLIGAQAPGFAAFAQESFVLEIAIRREPDTSAPTTARIVRILVDQLPRQVAESRITEIDIIRASRASTSADEQEPGHQVPTAACREEPELVRYRTKSITRGMARCPDFSDERKSTLCRTQGDSMLALGSLRPKAYALTKPGSGLQCREH